MYEYDHDIVCVWKPIWLSWYERGDIRQGPRGVERIYRNRLTERIRLYATIPMHDKIVRVNSETPVRLESRGRFGKLYLEVK